MRNCDSGSEFTKIPDAFEEDYEPSSHVFHKLMPFKIGEILLVSSLYDAFIIEEEGLIPELVIGEYSHLHLSSPPHVTRVSSGDKALSKLEDFSYDMVITMSKNIGMDPFDFGKKVKEIYPALPVVLLATDTSDLFISREKDYGKGIDKVFFWNGDSNLFLAIIKYVEDRTNVPYDTVNGNVRVIIMIEDSVRYYSMFLPIIYEEIVLQTQRLISEELNEMQRRLRMRARPKILLAETFEEGMELFERYKDYVLGIISDVSFKHNGKTDPNAGYKFIRSIKEELPYTPILLQSSKLDNQEKAQAAGANFIHKNSPDLLQDFRYFLLRHLGFGDFIFLLPPGKDRRVKYISKESMDGLHDSPIEIGRASDMQEFEQLIQKVPFESIKFHGSRNDFSNWLMARGEFKLAMELRPRKDSDFTDSNEVRKYLVRVFQESRREKQLGLITDFARQTFEFGSSFTRLGGGSLGGKGRGIAFMRSLLVRYDLQQKYRNISITVPNTVVIGTEEFDRFISDNDLRRYMNKESLTDREIARAFLESKLSGKLKNDLNILIQHFTSPLAVRSSSLLEDSQNQPFAGIYSTYMLPNNHENDSTRLKQLSQAIKLVYASIFYKDARVYINATSAKVEEEKMAIVIQELVGKDYGGRFYPTFSGVAQSHNFYPVSYQTSQDGIASVAAGLGKAVVGGEKVLRFSPRYPAIIPELSTASQIFKNSQEKLYVLNTGKKEFELTEKDDCTLESVDIVDIEKDGNLDFIASTYDMDNGIIRDGIFHEGPRLITFAGVLKYDAFPLASLLRDILEIGEKSMGCPVELEFAVTLDRHKREKPTFSILQIRPLVTSYEHCEITWDDDMNKEHIFIRADKALGNGIIDTVRDIVYIPPETFDPSNTIEIAAEVGKMNEELTTSSSPYLLIGPGRWGSEDQWLGVPVDWNQISGVKVMIETALEKFNIEPSQGTHFFHNFISRDIGYITIPYNSKDNFIDWDWLNNQEPLQETRYVRHVRFSSPLIIKLDGRCGCALILKPEL